MKKNKVDIITLGCSKNLVDSEQLMKQFQLNGFKVTHDPVNIDGEIVVINTCAFIGDSQEESINLILDLEEEKRKGNIGQLYVMGCLSERFLIELKKEFHLVDKFYGKFNWKELLTDIKKVYFKEHATERLLTTPSHYAYIKISEGCNRTCAYCAIPIITGKHRSRPIEDILTETRQLVEKGVKEFQLIAQDLTYYGLDLYQKQALPELIEKLSQLHGVEWIRLHYGYPSNFPLYLLDVIRDHTNVCRYIDIALQHISDPMLKKMHRNTTKNETIELIQRLREAVPGLHLRTTMMVGFPGETDKDFDELIAFIQDIRFERMGAFAYSHERGTYAYKNYEDNIPEEIKQERLAYLMRIQEKIAFESNHSKINKTYKTIIDHEENGYYVGRTEFDSPEVDPEVLIKNNVILTPGNFYEIKIDTAEAFELYGHVTYPNNN